jgi:hypothetical protein
MHLLVSSWQARGPVVAQVAGDNAHCQKVHVVLTCISGGVLASSDPDGSPVAHGRSQVRILLRGAVSASESSRE